MGIPADAVVLAYLNQSIAGLVSACQRLMPLGQMAAEQDFVESQTRDCPCISFRGDFVLQSVSGVGIDAARVDRDTPVHQLSLCFERERFRVMRQDPPWKVVRAFPLPGGGRLVHLNNVSGGVLAGDRLALDVEVKAGAAAQITTTGATRLYRHRAGAADSEQQCAILGRRRERYWSIFRIP